MNDSRTTDESLIERFARTGDREAAAELASRHADRIYDLTLRILRNAADAGDATQATFLAALRGARGFRGESSVKTWLYRIAIREAQRIQNQRRRMQPLEEIMAAHEPASPGSDPVRIADEAAAREAIAREVAALPEGERLAVVLHYFHGLGYAEAAESLGCAVGTIGSRLAAARERLKTRLGAIGFAAAVPHVDRLLAQYPLTPAPTKVKAIVARAAASASPAPAAAGAPWIPWAAAAAAVAATSAAALWIANRPAPVGRGDVASTGATASLAVTAPSATPTTAGSGGSGREERPAGSVVKSPAPAKAAFKVQGVVREARSGLPIQGACVVLERLWPPMPPSQVKGKGLPSVWTDRTGSYAIEGAVDGASLYRIEVHDPLTRKGFPRIPLPGEESAPGAGAGLPESAAAGPFVAWTARDSARPRGFAPFQVLGVSEARQVRADFEVIEEPSEDERARILTGPNGEVVRGLRRVFTERHLTFVSGTVQAEDGSHPKDVFLRVFDDRGEMDGARTQVHLEPSTGEFVAGPLPNGKARLEAVHATLGYAVAADVPVSEDASPNVVLTLRRGDAEVRGRVVDRDGAPVAGARVEVFADALLDDAGWIPALAGATTAKDGSFLLERAGNPGEALRAEVNAEGFRTLRARGVSAGDVSVRLVVQREATVRGRLVAKSTGHPIEVDPMKLAFPNVKLTPRDARPFRSKGAFQTAEEPLHLETAGGFWLVVGPGLYDLTVHFPGFRPFVRENVAVTEDGLDLGTLELEDPG